MLTISSAWEFPRTGWRRAAGHEQLFASMGGPRVTCFINRQGPTSWLVYRSDSGVLGASKIHGTTALSLEAGIARQIWMTASASDLPN